MVTLALALLTIGSFTTCTFFIKVYQMSAGHTVCRMIWMNLVLGNAVFVALFLLQGMRFRFTPLSLILAAAYGVMMWVYYTLKTYAAGEGPMAILSMSYVIGGVLIPALFGLLFLDEKLTAVKLISFILILAAFIPLIWDQKTSMVFSLKFILACCGLLVLNGVLLSIGKVAQLNSPPEYAVDYIALTYLFFYLTALVVFISRLRIFSKEDFPVMFRRKHLLFAGCAGLFNALGMVANYYLAFRIPASVQFPITQSSLLVTVTVGSLFLYLEKPRMSTIISLVLTIAGIALLSVGFVG
jgi:drug/metabolite transporter (DMT)-like permease